jgi:SAM-dependent methyltransferase
VPARRVRRPGATRTASEFGHTSEIAHYLFPRHPAEIDRLDIQHYLFREALGANYVAPVETPRRVLDVGCGTGQWAFEVCDQFPDALVVGLDLVASKPERPSHYRWVNGNVLQGLPLASGRFDFVHQRLLVAAVPVASWPSLVADLVRVTRRGGWVELVEVAWKVARAGPATERLLALTREMSASRGLDSTGAVFDSVDRYLEEAGLVNVERREIACPIGDWGGQMGSLGATDLRAAFTRICEVLEAQSKLTASEGRDLIRQAQEECEGGRMAWPAAVAFGRKPG